MSAKKFRGTGRKDRSQTKIKVEITGRFSSTPAGFGFVSPADKTIKDVFIPPKHTGTAIDGDIVSVELLKEPPRDGLGPVGKIVSVIQRDREFIVGEMVSSYSIRPLSKNLPEEIKVSGGKNANRGEWVKVRLLKDGAKHTEQLKGAVEDNLGKAGSVEADLKAVVAEFGLKGHYTEEMNAEADKLKINEIERANLTKLFCVTIDPVDAKDFDDAISIAPGDSDDEISLGVHISDVAAWIRPNSRFDKEAYSRSFSSYMPGMFMPMLPKNLTAKISLREKVETSAHSVIFTVKKSTGAIISSKRMHSKIKVTARLSFNQVQDFIDDPALAPKEWTPPFRKNLTTLIELTRKMRQHRRDTEQFLEISTAEVRVICDEATKEIKGIERKVQREADQLVEDCMLAANSAVADELLNRKIPGLFRVHPEPTPEKIEEFAIFIEKAFKLRVSDISNRKECNRFLHSIPDDHRKPVIISHFLRSLPRAHYLAENALHFGLGKYRYCHFTSPIRRYPDLLVHQQLWAADTNAKLKSKKTLADVAEECSKKEERNDDAYYAANDRLKLHYLKSQGALENPAVVYEAVISKVSSGGLVCDIAELGIYGFVPSKMLHGEFHHKKRFGKLKASRGRAEYKVGDFVYLVLDSLDTARGTALFRPAM